MAILATMSAAIVQILLSSVVTGIARREVMTTGRGYYNNMDHMDKNV